MIVTYWGTRGSISTNAHDTAYGGNTPCVSVSENDELLILDAGSGIRSLGDRLAKDLPDEIHILLTHLHMDHIQGLGFFKPFFMKDAHVHLWGPAGSTSLTGRLNRYLSPPLFPVRIRDFNCHLHLHEVPMKDFTIGSYLIKGTYVCHPGPTLGFRIQGNNHILTYIPDHEPALGVKDFPMDPDWTSGYSLAVNTDLLIHDAQFSTEEYKTRRGWGHSAFEHTIQFAEHCKVKQLSLFHHDPTHSDEVLEALFEKYAAQAPFPVHLSRERQSVLLE